MASATQRLTQVWFQIDLGSMGKNNFGTHLLPILLLMAQLFSPTALADSGKWQDRFHVFGYADVVLGENRYESETVGFDAYHFTTNINVNVAKHWRLFTDVTYEHGPMHTESSTNGDIKVRYQLIGTYNPWLELKAGKFLSPYGEQNTYHDASPTYLSVTSPRSIYWKRKINPSGSVQDRLYAKEAAGLWFTGGGHLSEWFLSYDLYVTNGRSDTSNPYKYDKKDHDKPIGARLELNSPDNIKLGLSYYTEDHQPTNARINV